MAKFADCKVCGKPFKVCMSCRSRSAGGAYNWREVACSPECGDIYLQRIIASRTPTPADEKSVGDSVLVEPDTIGEAVIEEIQETAKPKKFRFSKARSADDEIKE